MNFPCYNRYRIFKFHVSWEKGDLMQNRAGSFITNLSGEMAYQSFRPTPLPPVPDIELNRNLVAKLVDANRKIAVLEGLACRIPNPEDMQAAMSDLEKYMNGESNTDPLIQASLIHYQFETIHPFLDGNGRVGRLLITLFLMEKSVLSTPALYISYYLKMNRIEYYDRMTEVRRTGDYEQWVTFFLQAFAESADDAIQTVDKLTALHDKNLSLLDDISSRQRPNVLKVFTYLEANPIIDIQKTATALTLSYNTVAKVVALLQEKGILKQTDKAGKAKIYSYDEYLNILRKDT